jgi:hypothetical protein
MKKGFVVIGFSRSSEVDDSQTNCQEIVRADDESRGNGRALIARAGSHPERITPRMMRRPIFKVSLGDPT